MSLLLAVAQSGQNGPFSSVKGLVICEIRIPVNLFASHSDCCSIKYRQVVARFALQRPMSSGSVWASRA
jgi:hypothetical protein